MSSEDVQSLFAARGLRCTRQRKAIYEALRQSREHPTADELFRSVCPRGSCEDSGISLATVYNTLEAFCQAGIAHKLPGAGDNGSARYDAVRGNHLHLRCQRSGAVADVPDDLSQRILDHLPPEVLADVAEKLGFEINQIHIELVGHYRPANA